MSSLHILCKFPALMTSTLYVLEQYVWCDRILLYCVIILFFLYKDLSDNATHKTNFT